MSIHELSMIELSWQDAQGFGMPEGLSCGDSFTKYKELTAAEDTTGSSATQVFQPEGSASICNRAFSSPAGSCS